MVEVSELSSSEVASEMKRLGRIVDAALEEVLPGAKVGPGRLTEAMRYSVFAGGKRLRPVLVLLWTELGGGKVEDGLPAACAVELVHTYSLIHDDLPAMDNDDLRRGMPTSHKKFGQATAILAGDALLTLAFEMLIRKGGYRVRSARLVEELTRAAGYEGMVAGQVADIEGENQPPQRDIVEFIHRHKTATLIAAACRMGVTSAGAGKHALKLADDYGIKLGMLFQMTDDLLDELGTAEELGKTPGKDSAQGKQTWPALVGISETEQEARQLATETKAVLQDVGGRPAQLLCELIDFVLTRKK